MKSYTYNEIIDSLKHKMFCYHCKGEVIWGGDHTFEDYGLEGDGIVSNLHCTKCEAEYIIYSGDKDGSSK
tara:strand:- start:62 stop:271 length:210 start_codon:yes stop_codon:yes gene_type:complete